MTRTEHGLFGLIALAVVATVAVFTPSTAEARAPRSGAAHATTAPTRGGQPRDRATVRRPAPPKGAVAVRHGGVDYHVRRGSFYRWGGVGYVLSRAPVGAALRRLPRGYQNVVWAGRRFRLLGDTWFAWSPRLRAWVVVDSPRGWSAGPRFARR